MSEPITSEQLAQLLMLADRVRQRLLYLHAGTPSIYSPVLGAAEHEPVAGARTQLDPTAPDSPYRSVHDALVDGWRIVHFPQQRGPFEDREIDLMGYEFILEKLVVINDDCD